MRNRRSAIKTRRSIWPCNSIRNSIPRWRSLRNSRILSGNRIRRPRGGKSRQKCRHQRDITFKLRSFSVSKLRQACHFQKAKVVQSQHLIWRRNSKVWRIPSFRKYPQQSTNAKKSNSLTKIIIRKLFRITTNRGSSNSTTRLSWRWSLRRNSNTNSIWTFLLRTTLKHYTHYPMME